MASFTEIVAELNQVEPEAEVEWRRVDALLGSLWETGRAGEALPALFALFERFPTDDGYGVLWGALHGIEALGGYEPELLASVKRRPSSFGIRMMNRLLNGGTAEIAGTRLIDVLASVATDARAPEELREEAQRFVAHQATGRSAVGRASWEADES